MTDNSILKPLVVGGIAIALDRLYIGETDLMRNAYFGGAVAVGNYASEYIAPLIHYVPIPTINKGLYDGKTLVDRIAEVSSSAGFAFLLNKYIMNNDRFSDEFAQRVAVIAIADVIGTYAVEYIDNKPLAYLTDARN